jgi:uncharacterized protein (TIGR03437 family)
VPIGLSPGVANVVVNNNGTTYRGFVQILPAQPDIFTDTNDAGGIAVVCNVTNPMVPNCTTPSGPFSHTSLDGTATLVPTVLEIHLTGVRGVLASEAKATIGATDITASTVRPNTNMFGMDFLLITLPASLANGDQTLVVTVTRAGGTFTSRGTATAPHIIIVP